MPRRAAPHSVRLPHLEPMLATAGPMPPDEGFAAEVKWDGARALAVVQGDGTVRLTGRRGTDLTARFPEVTAALASSARGPAILDGELVVMGPDGTPSFGLIQRRLHRTRQTAIAAGVKANPAIYTVFDLLWTTESHLAEPYTERRQRLEDLGLRHAHVRVPPIWTEAGQQALAWTRDHHLEGVILKRLESPYRPGARSRDWIKVKNLSQSLVTIGGWLPGGPAANTVRALLLGIPVDDGLLYVGSVGTGFSMAERRALAALLRRLDTTVSPFTTVPTGLERGTHLRYVQPRLVGTVEYLEVTDAGQLRHPTWKGLRET